MGNGIKGALVSRNPEVQVGFDRDPMVHHVATPRWFNQVRQAQDGIMRDAASKRLAEFVRDADYVV